jgi:hypothetical protein
MRILLLLSFSSLLMVGGTAQRKPSPAKTPKASEISFPTPIVFGQKNDDLPERLKLRGEITEISFARAYCGVIFWSGTARIKLLDKIHGYPHENVFVVIPCFLDPNNERQYLNKVVRFEVSKLYAHYNHYSKENPCYYSLITNTIDSHGVPFYCSLLGQNDILKTIERNSAP